jgi:hypothetical protein
MIVPELVERDDLDLFNKSCAVLENLFPMIYGGVKSRPGTRKVVSLNFSTSADLIGTPSSPLGDVANIQEPGNQFDSNAIVSERKLLQIDYGTTKETGTLSVYGLKFDYVAPQTIWGILQGPPDPRTGAKTYIQYLRVSSGGIGFSEPMPAMAGSIPITSYTLDDMGTLTSIAGTKSTNVGAVSGRATELQRIAPQRNYRAGLYCSTDGANWTLSSEFYITEEPQELSFNVSVPFRYIKIELLPTSDLIKTRFNLSYVNMKSLDNTIVIPEYLNLIDYYRENEKYLIVVAPQLIMIFKNHAPQKIFIHQYITDDVIKNLKWSYKDDTIIFTHKDMPPLRLLKAGDDWQLAPYVLENIPYHDFNGKITTAKTTSITPNKTDGSVVITGSGFTADMVGQYIDGGGAYARITAFVSATKISVQTIIPFYDTSVITSWKLISGYEPVWSESRGWPRACCFAQQRLFFGGSRDLPNRIWATRVGDYNNFLNIGNYDNDALDYSLDARGAIVNLLYKRNLQIFTNECEFVVPEGSFTPNGFHPINISSNGCLANICPIDYENIALYIEKYGKSIYLNNYSSEGGGFYGDNLSLYSSYGGEVVKIVLHRNPIKDKGDYLWIILDTGEVLVVSLNLSQNINAPARLKTAGRILSACVLDNEVYMIVRRGINTNIEILDEDAMDDCEMQAEISGGRINNLTEFMDRQICVSVGGIEKFITLDSNGNCDVDFPDGMAKVSVPFDWRLKSNPIHIGGQSTAIRKAIKSATISCEATPEISLNGQIKRNSDNYKFFAVAPYGRDCRYEISGRHSKAKILSVQLDINYGA